MLAKHKNINLIVLLGSLGRELSGEEPAGAFVWEGSDIDIATWDTSAEGFEKLKEDCNINTPHWLLGSFALYDPEGTLPQLKDEYGKWSVENRKKLTGYLWMQNLAIKRCALAFLEQDNIPEALWAARKAFELVLDITLLLDDFVPCTPKYDWHSLRKNLRATLVQLHTVDSGDKEAVNNAIIQADSDHWELKEELEEFLGVESIFDSPWGSIRFPIIRWL